MNTLEANGINPTTLGLLQYVKLNTGQEGYILDIIKAYVFEYETESGQKVHEILEAANLIKYIKTGRKDPWYRVRLSDKGETILKEMTQKPLHELTQTTLEFTQKEYKRIGADNLVSGGEKLLFYISEFLHNRESYTEPMMQAVIRAYIGTFETDAKYLNSMKTLFFKPSNVYTTRWNAESCPLISFIEKNQTLIQYTYKQYKK